MAEVPAGDERAHASPQLRHSHGVPAADELADGGRPDTVVDPRAARLRRGAGKYPAEVYNINNAARNLVEIIANEARNDTGDYRIRIYTIGMGQLVPLQLGTRMETSESILKRMANDRTSLDFNSAQLEGKYYYAQTAADVGPAFQALQNQILRLSK